MSRPAADLEAHVGLYAESHRTPVNRALHFVGIPVLMVSTLGLLSKLRWPSAPGRRGPWPDAAWPVLVGAGLWYLRSDPRVGLATAAALTAAYAAGRACPSGLLAALFTAGTAAHAIGHYVFEGKPPTLLSRPVAVLEAPAWLLTTVAAAVR